MKYFFIVAACLLLSATASVGASLIGSKHDLNSISGGSGEICRFCHSGAHGWLPGGVAGMGRDLSMATITAVYASDTLAHPINLATVQGSDAAFCLSCHDGAAGLGPATLAHPVLAASTANLGLDLSNDHPTGFVFNVNLKSDLKSPTTARIKFGASKNEIWCSTCHNVHSTVNSPFLVMSNTNSALCLDCHIK